MLPVSVGNFSTSLIKFNARSCKINGQIPKEVGNLSSLLDLDLSENILHLGEIYLGQNQLSGSIPNCLGNITSLREIHLGSNELSSTIPPSIGNLQDLVVLDLSSNNMVGSLPPEIGNQKAFQGSIPESMSNMVGLEFLDLSHNNISGMIPMSLEKLQYLKYFNVSENQLYGKIPLGSPFKNLSSQFFIDNEALCGSSRFSVPSCPSSSKHKSNRKKLYRRDVQYATGCGIQEFDTECEVLHSLHHRYLVKVITSCSNLDFKALVLEYMPNGSLEKYLYSHNYFLDTRQRLSIMIDVACALEYLHHGCSSPVIHCDLKPSNILLDEDMVAHLSNFGISKLLGEDQGDLYTKTLATLGYIAPEYGMDGLVSRKCDVYSYGIMLLETFTRRKPNEFEGDLSLKQWVSYSLPKAVMDVVDANLVTAIGKGLQKELDVVA
ncbi:hypothetical protein P3L10_014413 [Capsicum annuum]